MNLLLGQSGIRTLRHMGASVNSVLHSVRLTVIYLTIAGCLLVVWALSLVAGKMNTHLIPSSSSSGASHTTNLQLNKEVDSNTMQSSTSDVDNSASPRASVRSDNSGTTVTVNGESQTVPPDESFHQTFTSTDGSMNSRLDVSVQNNSHADIQTGTSGQSHSLNIEMHSSSDNKSNSSEAGTSD
jgi:hypothetical protein